MSSKPTLSVVLATFNEEDNIGQCLDSVSGLADEIIVFDESSTDKTRAIAKTKGAKVFITTHHPIFHITKNKAIAKASSDWVLQLDADERLTPKLREEIKKLIHQQYFGYDSWLSPIKTKVNHLLPIFSPPKPLSSPVEAYWIPRKNYFLSRYLEHTGQYPDPVIRLFKKGKAKLPAKNVHEQMTVAGKVGWLKNDLNHMATPNFARYLLRENRYADLYAQELYHSKVKINVSNTLLFMFVKPLATFLSLFIRYRGFLDGFPGLIFSLYSGLHFAFSYMKLWEKYKNQS